jgi:hypothetical protein
VFQNLSGAVISGVSGVFSSGLTFSGQTVATQPYADNTAIVFAIALG